MVRLAGLVAPLIVTILIVAGMTPGPGATAAGAQDGGRPPSILIVDQTTFVPADGVLDLVVDVVLPDPVDPTAGRPFLSVTFYGRLSSEDGVDEPPNQALKRTPDIDLDRAARTPAGHIQVAIPSRSSSSFDDQDRVLLREPGVYPVTVELRNANGPLASARTHLVRQPIETAHEPTEALAQVEVAIVLSVSTAEGLSADEATTLLAEHPGIPLTVVLDPGVINQLRSDPQTARALADALGGRPVLTTPTIDLDPSALAEIGQGDLYLAAARADRQALVSLGLQPAEGTALLASPLTDAGLDVLGLEGVAAVLDLGDRFLGSGVIEPDGRAVELIRTDRDLNRDLRGDEDGIPTMGSGPLRANRVLARLTLRRQIDERVVVIGGPTIGVDPGPALAAFLRSLSQPGAPRPVPLSAVVGGPSLRVAEQPEQDLAPVAGLVGDIRSRLGTYATFHRGGGALPEEYRQRLVGALTRQRNPADRLRALTLIAGQLDDDLGTIHIHQPQPVTLAARSASIPLVVENNASGPRQVLLRFRGDRVVSDDDGRLLVVDPGTSSIDIEIEARSLGVSPLEVTAWTPDGSVALAQARFQIRSTAVPGLGLLVSLSALGLLGVWWMLDHRRRRRSGPTDRDGTGPDGWPGAGADPVADSDPGAGATMESRPTTV